MDKFEEWLTNKMAEYEKLCKGCIDDGNYYENNNLTLRRYELSYVLGAYRQFKEDKP
jgi:hypothetical protein